MNRSLLLIALLLASPSPLRADAVDDIVQAQLKRQRIPGASVAVVRDGKLVKAGGYGLANIEHQVPARPETVYQSGSVGKQFTATAVMMLVEDGKLALDDPVAKHLPGAPDTWKAVTVRHLLNHTAGLKNYTENDLNYRQDYTEADLLKKLAALPLDFAPGEKHRYSNSGYMVLGFVIRSAAGEFYGDFLRKRIFAPLGMATARIITEEDIVPNRAAGYRLVRGQLKNQEWVAPSINTTADGALYLTVLDMAKWDAALYTEKLLKRSSLDLMWTKTKTKNGKEHPYGFGWALDEVNGHKVIEHGGAWQGFCAQITRYVDDKLTVIVLTNSDFARPWEIARAVAASYVPGLAVRPRPPQ